MRPLTTLSTKIAGLTFAVASLILPAAAHAAIVVVAPTSSTSGSFTITQDITFTLNTGIAAGGSLLFVLDEWVISDGGRTDDNFAPQLSISLNGGASQTYGSGNFSDNLNSTSGNVTPNDGFFYASGSHPALSSGDTVALLAGSYSLPAISNFNLQATQTFTGNLFMANNATGVRVSDIVAAPEPGTAALLLGGLALLTSRRRARRR